MPCCVRLSILWKTSPKEPSSIHPNLVNNSGSALHAGYPHLHRQAGHRGLQHLGRCCLLLPVTTLAMSPLPGPSVGAAAWDPFRIVDLSMVMVGSECCVGFWLQTAVARHRDSALAQGQLSALGIPALVIPRAACSQQGTPAP